MTIQTEVLVRSAAPADAPAICGIVNQWAERGAMLFRRVEQVAQNIGEFVVAEDEARVVGCAALAIYTPELAEIRSVAVARDHTRSGTGSQLVQRLLDEAVILEIPRVFLYTIVPGFFTRLGFRAVSHKSIPEEFARTCALKPSNNCVKRIAMMREILP